MKNKSRSNLEKESENEIGTLRDFKDMILFDISESEFRKLNNILLVILGSISPSMPLILLFRVDLIERINMILLLIILISTNLITTIIVVAFYDIAIRFKLDFIRSNIEKIKIKININIKKNKKNKKKRHKRLNKKLYNLNSKYISKEKEVVYNKEFMTIMIFNIMVGFFIVFAKVINYFKIIDYISFECILFLGVIMYVGVALRFIPYIICEAYNKFCVKILKSIMNKESLKSKYEQISIFDSNNIEL